MLSANDSEEIGRLMCVFDPHRRRQLAPKRYRRDMQYTWIGQFHNAVTEAVMG